MISEILRYVIGVVITFAVGYYVGKGDKETVTEERVVYRDGQTKTIYVDRVVTVTKIVHPDGTTEETTKTEESNQTTESHTSEGSSDTASSSKPVLPRYSVGVLLTGGSLTEKPDLGGALGMRTLGPVWVDVGFTPATRTGQLGVRLEW